MIENCKRSHAARRHQNAARANGYSARFATTAALLALLAGCAAPVLRTDVVAFHDWPADARRGYRLELTAEQRASLEQSAYAQALQSELAAVGFAPAADGRFLISFAASVRQRQERVYAPTPPFYGSYWYGGPGASGMVLATPIAMPGGWGAPPREVVRFDRELKLIIEDGSAKPPRRVYESTAFSSGPYAAMVPVFALMSRALLQQFPGPSGATRHIELELPDATP